ncbi:hypothetical protein DICPUDRAFT_96403 [Dictyostelium purpureum]|uniref:LIM-type zinc finger-containing protein n=1 Tax=Dictyostelium purpureum TaxID=5786 RepID=F0Z7X3_DICPU|nr:uncharacterized protein DICPUDRAFT_96403 [Dictyostelium purpureum]EGC39983.1 hypothetical protein DICPUDRAFT_96403 [Dictyostelium purpureum]|eukprot:XP_003283486.1 hypothetical protein DICPUDRAFT_96403 [Dictyostelium purpureum]
MIKANWSSSSAFNLELALSESQDWIERVVGEKFKYPNDFQESLKDGVFLCRLINTIKPGCVNKINNATTDFAKRENLQFFVKAAKVLGLRDTQLFESNDLYENHRVRNVAITLYWLGRAARSINTYKGPQLDLLKFQGMNCSACKKAITDNNYLATMTTQYHTSCCNCCNCGQKLDPKKKFYQEGNNMWCENCMIGATSIGSGNGPNKGKNSNKHDNDCSSCHGSLEKGYVPGDDGSSKYCTQCICDLCHSPLIGNFQVKDGKKICDDCTCKSCGKGLEDGFFEEGISKYCEPCANNRKKQPVQKAAQHTHGDHCDHGKSHSHSPTKISPTSTTNTNSNKPKDNCKICNKTLDGKQKKGDDRDKFCTPHEKDGCCGKCNKEINGPALQALDKNWHPECFSCEKCDHKFKPNEQIKKSSKGNPLCGPCSSGGNNKCKECNKDIVGNGVEGHDGVYHNGCFKCRSCDKVLKDSYQEIDNEPYCDPCAKQLNQVSQGNKPQQGPFITSGWKDTDNCDSCKKSLHGEVAKTGPSTYYHKGCFKCQGAACGAALINGYFPNNNKPYCKPCSDKMNTEGKCGVCSKPIVDGAIVKAGNIIFHKACFKCTKCNTVIGNGTALTRFSKPYCHSCFEKEKLQCAKCRNQITGEVVQCDHKDYCVKCAPAPTNTVTHGDRISHGWTIDPRSGRKKFN